MIRTHNAHGSDDLAEPVIDVKKGATTTID